MSSGDDRTFKVNFSEGGVEKLKERVRDKLKEFMGDYTDDTLVEYVIVLLRNGRHKEEAISELNVFLGDDSRSFVSWLWDHLTSNLRLYVHNLAESSVLASKVGSVVEELSGVNKRHERDEYLEQSAGDDNVFKGQGKRNWKGSVRDSTESISSRGQEISVTDLEENEHHTVTREGPSPTEHRKRRRRDDQRDSAQSVIDAPRRLLQFAVRDAAENCRHNGIVKDPPKEISCIQSVVSTSTQSSPLAEKKPRIQSVAHVLPGMSTVLRAVQEAAEDVKVARPRRSVFDRIGCDMHVDATRVRHINESKLHGAIDQVQEPFGEGDDDVYGGDEYEPRKTVASSNGFNIVNNKPVTERFNPNTWSSRKYVRSGEGREKPNKHNAMKIDSTVNPPQPISQTDVPIIKTAKGVTEVHNVFHKPVASNTGSFPAAPTSEDVDSRTIFVTNVNFSATKDSLSRHFNKFGEVLKVNINTDSTTRQPIGSAYVEFLQKEAADNALSLDGSVFLSRKLRVLKTSPAKQEAMANSTWARPPVRGSPYTCKFSRGSPGRYRSPLKHGTRSFQWKRGDIPETPRSLTYIRSESKPAANSGT